MHEFNVKFNWQSKNFNLGHVAVITNKKSGVPVPRSHN
jgi:hypothetical protein